MKPIVPHPDAEAEFHQEVEFYESRQAGLGVRFRSSIEAAVQRIREQPNFYPRYEDTECRECPVDTFPHVIYYLEREDYIWVLAFAHQRRKPGYWLRRLT